MRYTFLPIIVLFILASCGGDKKPPEAVEEHHEASAGNIVTLTEEQIKTLAVETGEIELKNLKTSISANGLLTVPNQNKAHVTPLYSGVIRSLFVQPGSKVRKGQAIAAIVNAELVQLQQELLNVNAQIDLAETEYKRQKELVEGNAAPLKRLQQVEAELKSLRARKSGLTEQLQALGYPVGQISAGKISSVLTVTAPISGTVSAVNAEIGSNVDAASPIAEIVDNAQLHLDLFVYEKDLPLLKRDQVVHFTVTNNPSVVYEAKIYSIGAAFVNETKTIQVHAMVLGDKTGLIDGMNTTATVSLGEAVVPAVPSDAIVNYQGLDYIFIPADTSANKHKEGQAHTEISFERIPVKKGVSAIGYTEITPLKDVPPGVKIVTKGAFFLLAKMTNAGEHE